MSVAAHQFPTQYGGRYVKGDVCTIGGYTAGNAHKFPILNIMWKI